MNKFYKSAWMGLCAMAFSTSLSATPIQGDVHRNGIMNDPGMMEMYVHQPTSQPGDALSVPIFTTLFGDERITRTQWNDDRLAGMPQGIDFVGGHGYGYCPRQPAPVPEPSTMMLLGTGLFGIGLWWRKRA